MTCEVRSKMSEFDDRTFHFYAQPDGTIGWPNSADGDLLKIARKEIDELRELLVVLTARHGPGPWTHVWLLESSRSDYPMTAFDTEELALEALEATRVRLVKRWKDEVTEIDNGAFSVMDDLYTITSYLKTSRRE
jgi:hypothetical protein